MEFHNGGRSSLAEGLPPFRQRACTRVNGVPAKQVFDAQELSEAVCVASISQLPG